MNDNRINMLGSTARNFSPVEATENHSIDAQNFSNTLAGPVPKQTPGGLLKESNSGGVSWLGGINRDDRMVDVQIGDGNNQSFGITFSKDFVGDIEGIKITEQFFESFVEEYTNETALGNNGTMQASAVRPGWLAGGGIGALVEVISGWVSPPAANAPENESDHSGDRCHQNPNADCDDYENPGCNCDIDPITGEPICC